MYWPGKYCLNREKCESIGGYVTTPRSIYGCGKCGAWLFVHKVPFTLQEHEKTTQTDKTRFFFARKRWTWYPTNNYYSSSHFNQPNKEKNNCVWTRSILLEIRIAKHVEIKNVFTFQPIKRLVSTTVKSAKPAATFWKFLLRTKNRQFCCLAVMEHIVLQERRVAITKNHLRFWINFSANHNQAHPNLNHEKTNRVQLWNKRIRFLLVDDLSNIIIFSNHFIQFQPTVNQPNLFNLQSTYRKNHDLFSLKRRNPVDSRFWSRLCYYCSKWSRTKYNNQFTRNTPSYLAIAVVSETRFLGYPSVASAKHSQPGGNNGDERWSNLQCGDSRLGH